MRAVAASLLALVLLPSCRSGTGETPAQAAAVKAAIDSLWTRYAEAADRRDREAFGRLFADDAALLFSNAPTIQGRAAIQEFLVSLYSDIDVTAVRVMPEDFRVSGTLAAQSGSLEEDFIEGERAKTEVGRFALIAERGDDRKWRIRRLVALADSLRE